MKNSLLFAVNLILLLMLFAYDNTYINLAEAMHVAGLAILNGMISLVCFIMEKKESGKTFILATFLVLLVGFGVCSLKQQYAPPFNWNNQEQLKK